VGTYVLLPLDLPDSVVPDHSRKRAGSSQVTPPHGFNSQCANSTISASSWYYTTTGSKH
jgi:hypothetical protein